MWTCHNGFEHHGGGGWFEGLTRRLIVTSADAVIVMHESVLGALPKSTARKSVVACFGDYREFVEAQAQDAEANPRFVQRLSEFRKQVRRDEPVLLNISTAKKSRLDLLADGTGSRDTPIVVVAPHLTVEVRAPRSLVFTEGFVYREIAELLCVSSRCIGFVGHCNVSVPTSLYLFCSYGLPVVAYDSEPMTSIIDEYPLGLTVQQPEDLGPTIDAIIESYDTFSDAARRFVHENSWERAAQAHATIFAGRWAEA